MLDEAIDGEKLLDDSQEDRAKLRRLMGLEAELTIPSEDKNVRSGEDVKPPGRRKRKPGERNPKRDPIGNGDVA